MNLPVRTGIKIDFLPAKPQFMYEFRDVDGMRASQ